MTSGADDLARLPSGSSTSRSLLEGAKRDEPEAWERIVRLYAPLVAAWCRRRGVREQDTTDILQEVFVAVAGHLDRFRKERPSDTFRGWLSTITQNKIRDFYRQRAKEPEAAGGTEANQYFRQVEDPNEREESTDASNDPAYASVLFRALESIRGEFQDRTWQAFWRVVVEGRTTVETASDLQMKPGAVRVAKSRVLMRLRLELGDAP
ncbi:MAG: sigma-70 family RNA polymerase sigma factor [Planctomycetota bacterium]